MPKRSFITNSGLSLTLDARPDRLDLRDLPYRPPVIDLPPIWPEPTSMGRLLTDYIAADLILDQRSEGACTGFGLAVVVNFLLWRRGGFKLTADDKVSPRMLYQLARMYDEWPGESYEGSSCRGALRGWQRHGVCREPLWPYGTGNGPPPRPSDQWAEDAQARPLGVYYRVERSAITDMQAAIVQSGAIYVSANVHDGWDVMRAPSRTKRKAAGLTLAGLPLIGWTSASKIRGGHAFALVGYTDEGFVIQNSWGQQWGDRGFAVITYADWLANGSDAWVVALGVPMKRADGATPPSKHYMIRSPRRAPVAAGEMGGPSAAPIKTLPAGPQVWCGNRAYRHSLVTGNDGEILNRLPEANDGTDAVNIVGHEAPHRWFSARPADAPKHLLIYAHGGLNSEETSIERIKALGPAFERNGIYPLFITWKSGWLETIADLLKDEFGTLFGEPILPAQGLADWFVDKTDRAIEIVARHLLIRSMWSEMKQNVAQSAWRGRGLDTLAKAIVAFRQQHPGLQVHLAGHSAGAYVCGRLLSEFGGFKADYPSFIGSCTLFAPACDLDFALTHYAGAVRNNVLNRAALRIHTLSDRRELEDSVGPYRKSLLYLVSRALEREHVTPLLGLSKAFDPACATEEHWDGARNLQSVEAWQKFFWNTQPSPPQNFSDNGQPCPGNNLFILDDKKISTGTDYIDADHGCFDNSVDHIRELVSTVLGHAPITPIDSLDF